MPRMEFGWKVPEFPADGSDAAVLLEQTETALALVQGQFHSAWVTDHMVPWAKWQAVQTPTIECWTTLTFLAARYPALTWGTIVLCQSYRNPALLAKMVANLCAYLPGKVVFGIGAGWKEDEYRAYNWPFPPPATRIRQLAETVEITQRLWREDDVTFTGREYAVSHAYLDPKPNPIPPIMIGGSGEQLTLKVVAQYADWWNNTGTRDALPHKLDVLREHCEHVGRDFDTIKKTWQCETVAVGRTAEEAQEIAAASPFYNGNPQAALIGTPIQVAEQLDALADLGISLVQLRFADFPHTEGIERFMTDVMPQFA